MKQKLFSLLMAMAFVLPFVSCEEETAESDMSLLTSGNWHLTFIEQNGVRQTAAQAQMQNSISFTTSGTWASSGSNGGVPDLQSGTYTLANRTLTLNNAKFVEVWTIKTLTKTSLITEGTIENVLTRYEFAK